MSALPQLPAALPDRWAILVRWLFSGGERADAVAIEDAWLVIEQGTIASIVSGLSEAAAAVHPQLGAVPRFSLGNVALIPGLVNAHTHLEFSHLTQPLGIAGMPLPDWIRLVIGERQASAADHDPSDVAAAVAASLEAGLRESLACGVVEIGEIASQRWLAKPFLQSAARGVAFRELVSTDPAAAASLLEQAAVTLAPRTDRANASSFAPGLSPHAPYSTSLELVRQTAAMAAERSWPLAMHLAESPAEIEYLATGGGPFRRILAELGVWRAAAFTPPQPPLAWLEALAAAPRSFVIHGNYLADNELQFLATQPERMTLVYCPRTHAYFRHSPYPLAKALEWGVDVAIGTDSRSSNPDLNLFRELQFIAAQHDVPRAVILQLGTKRLNRQGSTASGDIAPGQPATFALVQLPERDQSRDAFELLLAADSRVAATIIDGQLVSGSGEMRDKQPVEKRHRGISNLRQVRE